MENDRNEMIEKFCCITNVSEEVAKDCLECCGWKLGFSVLLVIGCKPCLLKMRRGQVKDGREIHEKVMRIAIEKFLANNDGDDVESWANENSNSEDDQQVLERKPKSEPEAEAERKQPRPKKKSGRENKVSSSSGSGSSANRIHTIHTIQNSDDGSDGSEDDDGQAFYAGGSERSGQQIIGPHKNKDMIKDMFKTLKENGGQVVDPDDSSSSMARNPRQQKATTRAFQGTGFKLGQSLDDSEAVPGTSSSASATSASAQGQRESAAPASAATSTDDPNSCVVLRMWRNGFTVDDGELRLYDDPENRNFLISIRRGETPLELLKNARNREVHVNMEDHHYKDYEPPTNRTVRAFGGQGYVLGNMVPNCTENATTSHAPSTAASTSTAATAAATPAPIEIQQIEIDGNLPSTNIQIRLRDGSRLNGRFNLTNTVADIKRFILMNKPEYGAYDFNLIIPFPRTKLDDESKTIQEANLMNTTLTQDIQ